MTKPLSDEEIERLLNQGFHESYNVSMGRLIATIRNLKDEKFRIKEIVKGLLYHDARGRGTLFEEEFTNLVKELDLGSFNVYE